jgi:dimethylaniline monooxygenase (N-oxide forming)
LLAQFESSLYLTPMRIGVIGGGISGVAAASVLQRDGHEVIVYERDEVPGGVWAKTYPKVALQNTAPQYHISDFPWPFEPDLHPTAEQIRRYLDLAIAHFDIDIRLGHEVTQLAERPDQRGWTLTGHHGDGSFTEELDFVLVAVGQYTQPKIDAELPGREQFVGEVVTEREITTPTVFAGKRVAVVGMGKSALDIAMLATEHGATSVDQVFRTARWLLPEHIFGLVHFTHAMFSRVGSVMMTSWAQPTRAEAVLHTRLRPLIDTFWATLGRGMWHQQASVGVPRGAAARARVRRLRPAHPFIQDMRSAAALVPRGYFRAVADGGLEPVHADLLGFSPQGVRVRDVESQQERELACDLVVLSLGSSTPVFPFMPAHYRAMLEGEPDGVQLYRHLIHPRIPRLAFTGYNHGFLHIPMVEVGALWIAAWIAGELELPTVAEMEVTIDRIRAWKRAHVTFEPSRACAVSTRHHQYLDILLQDLELSPYRKSNLFAEAVLRYGAADYAGLLMEHQRRRASGPVRLRTVALDS